MATSGSYNTNKYTTSSSGTIGLNLSWTLKSQDIVNNRSTISWTLKSNGTMSSGYYVQGGPITCTINGTKVVNTTSRVKVNGSGGYKKTGTLNIAHAADGSKSFSISVQAALYSASVNCTVSKSGIALPKINRYAQISSITSFTEKPEQTGYPTIVYTNPAGTSLTTGLKCRLAWDIDGTTNYSSWVTLNDEGGEYTFDSSTLTAANITSMLYACPDSTTLPVSCQLQSTFNGVEGSVYKDTTMHVEDSFPIVGTISYSDVNSTVVGKTGDAHIIVQKQSTLRVQLPTPIAQNGASISAVQIYINGNNYTMIVGSGIYYYDFVQPSLSGTFSATVDVMDTRHCYVTNSINVVIQPWEPPSALYTLARVNDFETSTTLYVSGSISSVSETNSMIIQEQHKKTDESTWSTATNVPNLTDVILSLNNSYSWDVKIIVNDEYATTEYISSVGKGIPIMFIDKDRNSVSVNGYPDADNQLYNDGTIKATGSGEIGGDFDITGRLGFEGYKCKLFTVGPFSAACTTHSGSYDMYITSDRTLDISSAGFNHVYFVFAGGARNTGTNMSWVCLESWTATNVKYVVARHTSMTLGNYTACFLVIGD